MNIEDAILVYNTILTLMIIIFTLEIGLVYIDKKWISPKIFNIFTLFLMVFIVFMAIIPQYTDSIILFMFSHVPLTIFEYYGYIFLGFFLLTILFKRWKNLPKERKLGVIIGLFVFIPLNALSEYKNEFIYIAGPVPDVMIMNDGSRVEDLADWDIRREEVKELLLEIEYGTIPSAPEYIEGKFVSNDSTTFPGRSYIHYILTIVPLLSDSGNNFSVNCYVLTPNSRGPYPVYLSPCGNIFGPSEIYNATYVVVNNQEFDPDTLDEEDIIGPAQSAYLEYTWGSLAVWGWGASRALDYIISNSTINSTINHDQIMIIGHSRCGKAALVSAATDERIDMVIASGSGTGGAGSFLIQGDGCERLATASDSWYAPGWADYGNKEYLLPFDQHFLLSLIAPRILLLHESPEDRHANPEGTQYMWMQAKKIYEFLGVEENIHYHYQPGGHDMLLADKAPFYEFLDWKFNGIPTSIFNYDSLPYPNLEETLESFNIFGLLPAL